MNREIETSASLNQEMYRRIVELAQEGIWVIDQNEITTFVNRCLADMLGYDVAEMIGKYLFDFMDEQGIAICNRNLERRKKGVKEQHDFELIRKDGKRIYTIMSVSPMEENGEYRGAIALVTDITRRRLMEYELKVSEEKTGNLIKFAPTGIFEVDFDGPRLISVNDVVSQYLEYSREELLAMNPLDLLDEQDRHFIRHRIRKWRAGLKIANNVEYKVKARSGREYYVNLNITVTHRDGKPKGAMVIAHDITERRISEEEKQITIEFLRLVNESQNTRELIRDATAFFIRKSGCRAVGIRLKDGDDYPYFETQGFPEHFVLLETRLCNYNENGTINKDDSGTSVLECMCGNVICGRSDPAQPFFTAKGSFWTNSTTELLASTSEADRKAYTRNRCNEQGYESVALIALRHGDDSLGLLQLNDKRKGLFSVGFIYLVERLADYLAVALSKFRVEEALQESQTRLRLALDAANSGTWEWDLRTGNDIWSDEVWKLYGLEPYSCKPSLESWWRIVHPGDQVRAENTVWEAAREGRDINIEWRVRNSDGPERWLLTLGKPLFDIQGQVDRFIGIVMDITERKRETDAILASERELLQVTLNSLGEGVVATDPEERIILINRAAALLTGYTESEAIGQPLSKILYIIDDQTSEPRPKIESHEIFHNVILVTRDLKEIPVSTDSSPIKTADGTIIGTVTVFQDISEKQKTERELLRADKLESLGILAGGIAHDFNNILAAILSNIQLAMLKLAKNEDIKPYLKNTIETARKASQLTKQLLTFSKGGAPVKKDASLIELIKDTVEFVLRGSNIKAEFAIPNDLWTASVDEGQISQVVHNLVLNAKQAMPRGGIIHTSAENTTIGEDSRFHPGKYVKIIVKDQGVGIAKENLSKIFDPFFSTKTNGNGLGLATSYSIITRHNGYIDVESQEDMGTSFFIYLPASNTPFLPVESPKEVAVSGGGFKILVMDDEQKILNAVGEMLRYYGYRVVLTADGAEAISEYKHAMELGEPFDAVLMDLTVPGGMGGQETVAYLRDFDPKIKAIVSSGYANDPILADYERYGFKGMVSKPYKIDELNEILVKVIDPAQLSLKLNY